MTNILARPPERKPDPTTDPLPARFNPQQHPILCRHWYGIEPFRQVGTVAAEIVADLMFRRKVQRLCAKGPRVVGELLGELGAERGLGTVIDQKLDRYLALADEALDATDAHAFPPAPIHEALE